MKNKGTAVLLCLFLGGIGAHKFYLNKTFQGLLYLLFSWTFIPLILSIIDLLVLLATPVKIFDNRYNRNILQRTAN